MYYMVSRLPSEVFDYVKKDIFRTFEFRDALEDENHYITKIIRDFSKYPRFFGVMSDEEVEFSHFTSWWNCITLRHYENPYISDVYYLHEIFHATYMTYDPDIPWASWYTKMAKNEFNASMCSEALIYLECPDFRQYTFGHEIWVDRFLNNCAFMNEWKYYKDYNPTKSTKFESNADAHPVRIMEQERIRAMVSPSPFDFLELQIHNYLQQNQKFASVWSNRYDEIERAMSDFYHTCDNGEVDRAIANYRTFIEKVSEDNPDKVPFYKEAKLFAKIYKKNKKNYGNHKMMRKAKT